MLKLEIITPESRVVDAEVDTVTVPTASGEAGILPNHAPLISTVKPGVLSYSAKGASDRLVVSSGFVEVSGNKVAILVDSAEAPGDLDASAAKAARDDAEKQINSIGLVPFDEAEAARESLDHAQARLQVAGDR